MLPHGVTLKTPQTLRMHLIKQSAHSLLDNKRRTSSSSSSTFGRPQSEILIYDIYLYFTRFEFESKMNGARNRRVYGEGDWVQ